MWDCFSSHAFGFRLLLSDGSSICVTDFDDRWEDFRARVLTEYPGIDSSVVQQVEDGFPSDQELTCWENQQAQQVGDGDALPRPC